MSQNRIENWLKTGKVRETRPRRVIAQLLIGDGKHRHVTAETVFEAIGKSGEHVALATVYNTLHRFCEAGLVKEITVDGAKSYFDTNTHDHPHFYWESSGKLSDAPSDELEIARVPAAPKGARISKVDVIIRLREDDL